MVKVGLVGIGFMGRGHLDIYMQLAKEGFPVELVAICDVDEKKFKGEFIPGNLDMGAGKYDFDQYNLYTDLDEMLKNEDLDYVDIALPTYLHAGASVKALNSGLHVLCEKPMARSTQECQEMIDAAEKNNKKLMIGQCLRFWPEYELLKAYVDEKKFGKVTGAYFYRGGGTPKWSFENWLLQADKSGGALLDQHVHDVDTIHWLFGKPRRVSTVGKNVIEGSGYDIVSTHYIYDQGYLVNAQDDWTLNGDYGFKMSFRVNFEAGSVVYENGKLTVTPNEGESFTPELSSESGYYREVKYFIQAIIDDTSIEIADPVSTKDTIAIAEAEMLSADNEGSMIVVK